MLIIFLIIFLIKLIKFDFPLKLKKKALKAIELLSNNSHKLFDVVSTYFEAFQIALISFR